jgi:hypothetical protein
MKTLLREYYELCEGGICQDYLTEGEKRQVSEGTAFFMTGCMQAADQRNGNGRVYSENILKREMEKYNQLIKDGRALGELDHPDSSVIQLEKVSHMVVDAWWEGNRVMGKVKVLNTPCGRVLHELAKAGAKLGISSRGMGSTEDRGGNTVVQDDFQLICFDFVSEPSTFEAYMYSEGKEASLGLSKKDRINFVLNEILRKDK